VAGAANAEIGTFPTAISVLSANAPERFNAFFLFTVFCLSFQYISLFFTDFKIPNLFFP
jgi:hypothetical protein